MLRVVRAVATEALLPFVEVRELGFPWTVVRIGRNDDGIPWNSSGSLQGYRKYGDDENKVACVCNRPN